MAEPLSRIRLLLANPLPTKPDIVSGKYFPKSAEMHFFEVQQNFNNRLEDIYLLKQDVHKVMTGLSYREASLAPAPVHRLPEQELTT